MDVNVNEKQNFMQDMDELDDDLFGTLAKRKNSPGVKKKVAFQDFNEEDPLADLLSDEDDLQIDPAPSSTGVKSSRISDLFGIKNTDSSDGINMQQGKKQLMIDPIVEKATEAAEKVVVKADEWSGLSSTTSKTVSNEQPRSHSLTRSDNITNDGIVPSSNERTSSIADKSKKSTLMEDLFGSKSKSTSAKDKYIRKEPTTAGLKISEIQNKSELLSKSSNPVGYAPTVSAPRESRRGRRSSGGIIDPLGMFSSSSTGIADVSGAQTSEVNTSRTDYTSSSNNKSNNESTVMKDTGKTIEFPTEDLPEWLGGPKQSMESSASAKKEAVLLAAKPADIASKEPHTLLNETAENTALHSTVFSSEQPPDYSQHLSVLSSNQFNQHATLMSLQQQEHELRTAATLSKQSEQWNKMIESQRTRLNDQEKQFNILIKRQIDRQELLEAQMKAQQERINSHLQVLLAQPTSVPMGSSVIGLDDITKDTDASKNHSHEFEHILEKLQAEKFYFENILDRLKDQHQKEIAIIEESYTRHIEIVDERMVKLEKCLRQDAEIMEADYEAKLQKMKGEQELLKIAHGEEIEDQKQKYTKRIKEIQDQQHRNLELVQKEYIETIENISRAKEIERENISNATIQTVSLNDILQTMKVTLTEIGEMKIKFEKRTIESDQAKELILSQQIEEIKDLKEYLKKQHECLEEDRKEVAQATRRLDGETLRVISEFDSHLKENREADNRLKSREEALVKEKELLDTQIQWERRHIQTIKDAWIKEQERQAKQLAEERHGIAAEKARLETLRRLKLDDSETAKAELEAALCTARDASNLANRERQKWRERLAELEVQKQQLVDKENSLTLRAKELEDLTQSALEKRDEGLKALKQAHYLEEQQKAYLEKLQLQSRTLAQRENKLAAEKLALSRERLALRMTQVDKPEKDVERTVAVRYNVDQEYPVSQFNVLSDSQMSTHFKDIVDPRLVLLKIDLANELNVSNDLSEL